MENVYKYMKEQGENSHWKKTVNEEIRFRMEEDFVDDDIEEEEKFAKTVNTMIGYFTMLLIKGGE